MTISQIKKYFGICILEYFYCPSAKVSPKHLDPAQQKWKAREELTLILYIRKMAIAWTEGENKGVYTRILFDSGSQIIHTNQSGTKDWLQITPLRRERLTVGSFRGKENESLMNVVEVVLKENPDGKSLAIDAIEVDISRA
uniref:Uncharacterized protein n=1 Tax=Rhipicephalus zambeziensis TaxID=60191 RepID=A0A224Z1N5_9ACAR